MTPDPNPDSDPDPNQVRLWRPLGGSTPLGGGLLHVPQRLPQPRNPATLQPYLTLRCSRTQLGLQHHGPCGGALQPYVCNRCSMATGAVWWRSLP